MPPDLQIYLLGTFRLMVKGAVVPNAAWEKRKARLLVQILALQPIRELHREELIEKLFPEVDEKTANARFYRVLYAARHALEPKRASYTSSKFLINDGQQIKITANGLWIDAEEFEQKARDGLKSNSSKLLESAAQLYNGDLLADEPFEEWITYRREQLRMLFHKVLHRLAETAENGKEYEASHLWLDKILQIEPADETAHRAKMHLFWQQGERFHALRQYQKCAAVLSSEFAIEPDEETMRLRQKIIKSGGR
jgi:DNA-binding SARP family transcriptional activator